MKKILVLMFCAFALFLPSCGPARHYSNQKADDAISEAIYQELGGEQVYYQGKWLSGDNAIYYEYMLDTEQQEQLKNLMEAANKAIQQENTENKIIIGYYEEIPGALSGFMCICNYSDENSQVAYYKTLQNCRIWGSYYQTSIYNDPATYSGLSGIKYLEVSGKLAEITEQENIDWYEYFPDLETLEVITEED